MLVTLKSTVGFKLPEEQEDALDFEKSMSKEWTKVCETEKCVIFAGETFSFGMLYSRYGQIFGKNRCNCAKTEFDPNVKKDCAFYRTEENMGAHDPYCKKRSGMPYDLHCSNCKDYIRSGVTKMTNQEAIKTLEYALYCVDEETPKGANEAEAIPMAIEALKAQDRPIICPRCGRTFAESEGREE